MKDSTLALPEHPEFWKFNGQGVEIRADTPEEKWRDLAHAGLDQLELKHKEHAEIMFIVGDILAFGDRYFHDTYADVIDATREFIEKNTKTLQNVTWVAKKIRPHVRKASTLSLSIHAEVAALPEEEQVAFLDAAESENMTVAELRKKIREAHPKDTTSTKKPRDVAVVDLADEAGLTHGIEVATRYIKDQADGPETWTKERLRAWQTNVQDIIRAFGMVDSIALTSANSASAYLMEEGPETISKWSEKKKTKWRTALAGLQAAVTALGKPEDPM
jgi:hypothetical protein